MSTGPSSPPPKTDLEEFLSGRLKEITELRWDLHRHPCLSGQESDSSDRVKAWIMERFQPDGVLEKLGETGLAIIFESGKAGPSVMLRADLDALPMDGSQSLPHRSLRPGIAHQCGHDGHTATVAGIGFLLQQFPLPTGRAILLFQPAEETGTGARAVLADPRFTDLSPDWAFGLHNVPGLPLGQIRYRSGPFAPASEGMRIKILGRPSHAGEPHKGQNPAAAVAQIIQAFLALPQELEGLNAGALVTPTSLQMGHGDFGISPGEAELCFTLRAESDQKLARLAGSMREKSTLIGSSFGLQLEYLRNDPFPATINSIEGVKVLDRAFEHLEVKPEEMDVIFPWSEDFGEFLGRIPGAFFALGAGEHCPPLHSHEYDFPDELIAMGILSLYTAAWMASEPIPG